MIAPGSSFGAWTVSRVDGRRAFCHCVCGTPRLIAIDALVAGENTGCGCSATPSPAPETRQRDSWRRPDWRVR